MITNFLIYLFLIEFRCLGEENRKIYSLSTNENFTYRRVASKNDLEAPFGGLKTAYLKVAHFKPLMALKDFEYRSKRKTSNSANKNGYISKLGVNNSEPEITQVSKNISAVLETLLMDYNKLERPGLKEGKITTIKMNMLIKSMGPITEKEMSYSMDCYVRQEWRDERLKFKGPLKQLTLDIKMLEEVWKPDTYFHNGLLSYIHIITRPNKLVRIDQNGKILYSMRLTIKAKCPMDLQNFPMDKQSCPLLIGSFAYTAKEVRYEWDKKRVSFEPEMTLNQFDLLGIECQNYSAKWKKGGIFTILRVNFILERHTGYYLMEVYVPCILIVVLSWVSFWINREATSDRVGLGITTVLTLSTIGLDTRTDLPKVHYATALDRFILMSFGYCIATVLQFAAVHYFTKLGSGENPSEENEWIDLEIEESFDYSEEYDPLSSSFPSLKTRHTSLEEGEDAKNSQDSTTGCRSSRTQNHVHKDAKEKRRDFCVKVESKSGTELRNTETQTDHHDSFWSQFFHCITGNDRYRKERTLQSIKDGSMNSVSAIDSFSKILFPVSYSLLNLWYWYSYYHTEIEHSWVEPGFDYFDVSNVY